jgi:hypothetical protein
MRRSALVALAAGGLATAALSRHALAAGPRRTDPRVLGTWRSDKERTVRFWRYTEEPDPVRRRDFERLLGKLTRRFTETHAYGEYDGDTWSDEYWVVDSDARSVVVAYRDDSTSYSLQQIFFEKDSMYVVAGYNLEFFRRVRP